MLDHLVILGGGFAGSLAAIACAGRARRVTLVERSPHDGKDDAVGTPQSHHVHIFSSRGQSELEALVPGILDELRAHGASEADWAEHTLWDSEWGPYPRHRSGVATLLFSRKLLNRLLWARVVATPNVTVVRAAVRDIVFARGRIAEVRLGDGTSLRDADLYVDARGRSSPLKQTLEAAIGPIPSRVVRNTIRYTTTVVDRPEGHHEAIKQYYRKAGPSTPVGYYASQIEGGRMIFTAVDYFGTEAAPLSRLSHHPALVGRSLAKARAFANLHNVHVHYGKARRWIANLAVVGDAVCRLNPVFGLGLTMATEHVGLLVRALDDRRPDRTRRLQRAIDASITPRWIAAVIDERRSPRAPFAVHYALCHAIMDALGWAGLRSRTVHRTTLEVLHGTRSPVAFFLPMLWLHVALACARALVEPRPTLASAPQPDALCVARDR